MMERLGVVPTQRFRMRDLDFEAGDLAPWMHEINFHRLQQDFVFHETGENLSGIRGAINQVPEQFRLLRQRWTPRSLGRHINQLSRAPTEWREVRVEDLGVDLFLSSLAAHLRGTREPILMMLNIVEQLLNRRTGEYGFSTEWKSRFSDRQLARFLARVQKDIPPSGHVVLVWDLSFGEDGRIEKILILNSWGPQFGERGFMVLDRSYLLNVGARAMIAKP